MASPAGGGRPGRLVRAPQDLATGLLFVAIGAVGLGYSLQWPAGTPAMMDSGFFPQALSAFILLSGAVMLVKALLVPGISLPGVMLRPLVSVTLTVVGFALAIENVGLVLAILVIVAISSFAGAPLRPLAFVTLWAALSLMCVGIFVWGVELPLRVWPF